MTNVFETLNAVVVITAGFNIFWNRISFEKICDNNLV